MARNGLRRAVGIDTGPTDSAQFVCPTKDSPGTSPWTVGLKQLQKELPGHFIKHSRRAPPHFATKKLHGKQAREFRMATLQEWAWNEEISSRTSTAATSSATNCAPRKPSGRIA